MSDPEAKPEARARLGKAIGFRLVALLLVFAFLEGVLQLGSLLMPSSRATPAHSEQTASDDELRLLCVGDSNTFGAFVPSELAYPAQLARTLEREMGRPVRAINVGEPGRNTAIMLRDLPAQLAEHRPHLVILLGGANNAWNVTATEHWGRPSALDRIDRALSGLRTWKLVRLIGLALRGTPAPGDAATEGTTDRDFLFRVTRDDAIAMIDLTNAAGARPVLQSYFANHGYFPLFSRALEAAASARDALYVNHFPSFAVAEQTWAEDEIYFRDAHLKPPGYHIVATNLSTALQGREAPDPRQYLAAFVDANRDTLARRQVFDSLVPEAAIAFDLYNRFDEALLEASGEPVPYARMADRLEGRWRFGIHLPAASAASWRDILLPAESHLLFRLASSEPGAKSLAPGQRLRIELVDRAGERPPIVFERSGDGADSEAIVEFSLAALGERRVDLRIAVEAAAEGVATSGPPHTVVLLEPVITTIPLGRSDTR